MKTSLLFVIAATLSFSAIASAEGVLECKLESDGWAIHNTKKKINIGDKSYPRREDCELILKVGQRGDGLATLCSNDRMYLEDGTLVSSVSYEHGDCGRSAHYKKENLACAPFDGGIGLYDLKKKDFVPGIGYGSISKCIVSLFSVSKKDKFICVSPKGDNADAAILSRVDGKSQSSITYPTMDDCIGDLRTCTISLSPGDEKNIYYTSKHLNISDDQITQYTGYLYPGARLQFVAFESMVKDAKNTVDGIKLKVLSNEGSTNPARRGSYVWYPALTLGLPQGGACTLE